MRDAADSNSYTSSPSSVVCSMRASAINLIFDLASRTSRSAFKAKAFGVTQKFLPQSRHGARRSCSELGGTDASAAAPKIKRSPAFSRPACTRVVAACRTQNGVLQHTTRWHLRWRGPRPGQMGRYAAAGLTDRCRWAPGTWGDCARPVASTAGMWLTDPCRTRELTLNPHLQKTHKNLA